MARYAYVAWEAKDDACINRDDAIITKDKLKKAKGANKEAKELAKEVRAAEKPKGKVTENYVEAIELLSLRTERELKATEYWAEVAQVTGTESYARAGVAKAEMMNADDKWKSERDANANYAAINIAEKAFVMEAKGKGKRTENEAKVAFYKH
jgi:hypothetical protein